MITRYIKLEPIGPLPLPNMMSKPWSRSFIFDLNHSTLPSTSSFTTLLQELQNVHVTTSKTVNIPKNTQNFHRPLPLRKKLIPIPINTQRNLRTKKQFENKLPLTKQGSYYNRENSKLKNKPKTHLNPKPKNSKLFYPSR
jgi:hypothetical protein